MRFRNIDILEVSYEKADGEYREHGEYISQDEDSLSIKRSIDGFKCVIPKSRITKILVVGRVTDDD